ncbi:hypothetical protein RTP6_002003 [Batrachochytrium dendrobatidis]
MFFADEILLNVLLYIQPHVPLQTDSLWNEQTADPRVSYTAWSTMPLMHTSNPAMQQYSNADQLSEPIQNNMFQLSGFHRNINRAINNQAPDMLIFGGVCRQWRRVTMLHSFWTELAWHRLLPRRPLHKPARDISQFLECMAAEPSRLVRIRHIHLDLLCWHHILESSRLSSILHRIHCPHRVHTVVLRMRWDANGDPNLIKTISKRFSHCNRLYIQGGQGYIRGSQHMHKFNLNPTGGALYGLDNKAARMIARSMTHLTHLFLDGFGENSFSWSGFVRVLEANQAITSLSVGIVRNGIHLNDIARILPKLKQLSVQFHVKLPGSSSFVMNNEQGPLGLHLDFIAHTNRKCVPHLYGDLNGFQSLECLAFHDTNGSEEMSSSIITRLLDTLPNGKMIPPKMAHCRQSSSLRLLLG